MPENPVEGKSGSGPETLKFEAERRREREAHQALVAMAREALKAALAGTELRPSLIEAAFSENLRFLHEADLERFRAAERRNFLFEQQWARRAKGGAEDASAGGHDTPAAEAAASRAAR